MHFREQIQLLLITNDLFINYVFIQNICTL